MKKFVYLLLAVLLTMSFCACGDDTENTENVSEISESISEVSVTEDKTSKDLQEELVGEWGRLDEVMHYFYSDGTCIIGGMQGSYSINDELGLVLTTMSGSVTVYEWSSTSMSATSDNYWYLENDTITINGNQFVKIAEEETSDSTE